MTPRRWPFAFVAAVASVTARVLELVAVEAWRYVEREA